MNIGIDARGLDGNRSGIPIYIEEILKQFSKIDSKNKYILYSTRKVDIKEKLSENIIIKDEERRFGSFWMYLKLPKILKEDNIDVFWGTQHLLPMRNKYTKNIKFVLTIHDLAIKKLKTVGSFKNTIIQKLFVKRSLKSANRIIAISEATKKDIIELYKIKEEKISVVYNGTNLKENNYDLTVEQENEIQEKFNIKDTPYIFFLSTIEPRKNVETLIKAYEQIREKGEIIKLILAGGLGWKYEGVLELREKSKYRDDIYLPGYISKEEKTYLFKNAKCFVYPSLYEGFGLPILEAMINKQIVVTANNSSLPEVGGEAAFYYDETLNYQNLGNKIIEVLNLSEEKRNKKIEEGLIQAKRFTWEKCAKKTLDIIGG